MEKGKTPTVFVLVLEIAAIIVLHAVKINQTEKVVNKEAGKSTILSVQSESRVKSAYTLAIFKYK